MLLSVHDLLLHDVVGQDDLVLLLEASLRIFTSKTIFTSLPKVSLEPYIACLTHENVGVSLLALHVAKLMVERAWYLGKEKSQYDKYEAANKEYFEKQVLNYCPIFLSQLLPLFVLLIEFGVPFFLLFFSMPLHHFIRVVSTLYVC